MTDSSLGFQNIFTFGQKDEEADASMNLSVVEIWMPYDRTLRMAAETDSALIEVERDEDNPNVKNERDVCSCSDAAANDAPYESPSHHFNAPQRSASCASVKSALSWNDTSLTTPYTDKENRQESLPGTVSNKYKTDSPTHAVSVPVPHKRAALCKNCYTRKNLKRPAVFFCCAAWFLLSFMLAVLLILYSQGSLADREAAGADAIGCKGTWSEWSDWKLCSNSPECKGQHNWKRTRLCKFQENTTEIWCCSGHNTDIKDCSPQNCSMWGEWTSFSLCSRTCGSGLQERSRVCLTHYNSEASNCTRNVEERSCNEKQCSPINGGWSPWQPWSKCSHVCGGGMQTRNRTCTNPSPRYRGSNCEGNDVDRRECSVQDCSPVDGSWSSWLSWSICTVTCGEGTQVRVRSCSNPPPQWGGAACQGESSDMQTCNEGKCPPVHGNWSMWSAWTPCSRTCGLGTKSRMRSCTNPPPMHDGNECVGSSVHYNSCRDGDCPAVNGSWTSWSSWTSCSDTCGGGSHIRIRSCTNPPPSNGGKSCSGSRTERQDCNTQTCPPVDGSWGPWEKWSQCSHTCGIGVIRQRTRNCDSPPPHHGGKSCNGDSLQQQACHVQPCRFN